MQFWDIIFKDNDDFVAYSNQHYIPIILLAFLGLWVIHTARNKWNKDEQKKLAFWFSLITPIMLLLWLPIRYARSELDITDDLPFHLCHFVSFLIPIMLYYKQRALFGILYFWTMAAVLQALITPSLDQAWPHFIYVRYWLMHAVPVIFVLYAIIVFRFKPNWKDFVFAVIATQLYFFSMHLVNWVLNSNYVYTMRKPEHDTLLNYLGDWPWYIVYGELLMFAFYLVVLIPFLFQSKK